MKKGESIPGQKQNIQKRLCLQESVHVKHNTTFNCFSERAFWKCRKILLSSTLLLVKRKTHTSKIILYNQKSLLVKNHRDSAAVDKRTEEISKQSMTSAIYKFLDQ